MSASTLGFRSAVSGDIAGSITLSVNRHGGQTRPAQTDSYGVLRLMKPLYLDESGQLTYVIVNPGGAYFGEKYRHTVDVGLGANLLLSSQGATRIYKTPNEPAVQEMDIKLGSGSRLEYIPDQIIAYKDAYYRQSTRINVTADSQAFIGEIVTPGWDPDDANFTYRGMHLRNEVRNTETSGIVCVDNVLVEPGEIGLDIDGIGFMEGTTHMGSVLVLGTHTAGEYADAVRTVVEESGLERAGVTAGQRHGISWLLVRALANSTDSLNKLILDVNEYDRSVTTGQSRLDLRRY